MIFYLTGAANEDSECESDVYLNTACLLVELANEFNCSMGLHIHPTISVNVLDNMGLEKVPCLRVALGFDKNKLKKKELLF